MTGLRRFLFEHRGLAAGIVALAMVLKMLVPAGYMVGNDHGTVTIELCTGYGAMTTPMAMPGMAHHQDRSDHQGKEMPCAFSGLTAASLAAADPVLLAIAVAILFATLFRVEIASVARAPAFLRPPLRGPPPRA